MSNDFALNPSINREGKKCQALLLAMIALLQWFMKIALSVFETFPPSPKTGFLCGAVS